MYQKSYIMQNSQKKAAKYLRFSLVYLIPNYRYVRYAVYVKISSQPHGASAYGSILLRLHQRG